MDFYVVMGRPGFRVSKRKRLRSRIGKQHRVTRDETKEWFKSTFQGLISEAERN